MPAANRYIGDLINKPLLVVADDKTESGSAKMAIPVRKEESAVRFSARMS